MATQGEPDPTRISVRTRVHWNSRDADDWSVFHLRADAPEWALDAMFKEMSKRYHPDVTGNQGEAQRILNETWERLKQTFRPT